MYLDTPENFAIDVASPYTFLGTERLYEPGVRHFIDDIPQPLEWPEGDSYIAAIDNLLTAQFERNNPPLTLPEVKEAAKSSILNITGQFIDAMYPPTKKEIYRQKQLDITLWQLSGGDLPKSVAHEWDNDWAGRLNEDGYVLAEGPGVMLKCRTAADLFSVWRVNAAFADYVRVQMEPLRTRAQADVQAATDAEKMNKIVAEFGAALDALPLIFITEELPGLLAEYNIEPA